MQATVTDTRDRTDRAPVSARGWIALALSLVATFATLAAIMPLATGSGVPVLPWGALQPLFGPALYLCWPIIFAAIIVDLAAGIRGGNNRAAALVGGILLALVGAYAVIVFAVDVNELTRLAS